MDDEEEAVESETHPDRVEGAGVLDPNGGNYAAEGEGGGCGRAACPAVRRVDSDALYLQPDTPHVQLWSNVDIFEIKLTIWQNYLWSVFLVPGVGDLEVQLRLGLVGDVVVGPGASHHAHDLLHHLHLDHNLG